MPLPELVLPVCVPLAVVLCLSRLVSYRSQKLPLPPGPTALPILGNLLDWPWEKDWETWAKWSRQYGDIVYVTLGSTSVIVINSVEAANATLNDKGAIYSDRPQPYFVSEQIGWKNILVTFNDGPRLRAARRLLLQELGTKAVLGRFEPMVLERARHFAHRILEQHSPEALLSRTRVLFSSIILDATYGYQVKDEGDELVPLIERVVNDGATYATPGSIFVDVFPWIKWLPSWMPGTGYRALGRKLNQEFNSARDIPYTFTQRQIATGMHRPSFIASHLEGQQQFSIDDESLLKHTALVMYGAGAETTVSAGYSFLLMMTLYPEVQARAQAEIDSVVGATRLPKLSDRDHLPYLNAVISEVLRFSENAPVGVPHRLREEDIHNGFLMPKGSYVISNIWAMCRDSRVYTSPEVFNPDRFMGSQPELDPRAYVFGFGRRICPGRLFAENSLFIMCATVLAALNVEKAHDTDGNEITPPIEYEGTNARHLKPFSCKIRARSTQAEALLSAEHD